MFFPTCLVSLATLAIHLLANGVLVTALPQAASPSSILSALTQVPSSAVDAMASGAAIAMSTLASVEAAASSALPAEAATTSAAIANGTFAIPTLLGEVVNNSASTIPFRMFRGLNPSGIPANNATGQRKCVISRN